MAVSAAVCGIAIVVYLAINDPATMPAPRCLFKLLTGYDCPGCGSQRALHALLNGHFGQAWHYNAALFFALPLAAFYALPGRVCRAVPGLARVRRALNSPAGITAVLAAILAWWILRNLWHA